MSSERGNNPELWNKLLNILDEKLQLGLLDHLRRANSYHFEDGVLSIEPATKADQAYLSKSSVQQHLQLMAQDAGAVDKVRILNAA